MSVPGYSKPYAIVDIETTGASPGYDRIIEIAVIRVEGGKVVERFESLLDPEKNIAASIVALTGINPDELEKAPTFATIAYDLQALFEGSVFVAHNVRFDYGFVKSEFERLGITFSMPQLCTVALSRNLYSKYKRHDLSSLIDRHDLTCTARHRAMGDADVLVQFLELCNQEFGEEKALEMIKKLIESRARPLHMSKHIIDDLPQKPGVYIFYGEDGDILYIGKSINIKTRVISHFAKGNLSGRAIRMAEEVRDIEAITTSGELSALLLESEMIKEKQPLYNRASRKVQALVVAYERTVDGYKNIFLERYTGTEELKIGSIVGVFKSVMQAKKVLQTYAKDFSLCPALLSIEKKRGACFYSQLGMCKGACNQKEHSDDYNLRFDTAFAAKKLKSWPYSGPILVKEEDKKTHSGTGFIIDNWRLMGSFRFNEEGETRFLQPATKFDYDSYKILTRYIEKATIKPLSEFEASQLLTNM